MLIKCYRKENNITQKQIAIQLGLSQSAISAYETGGRQISPKQALLIERLTNGAVTRYELRPDLYPRD